MARGKQLHPHTGGSKSFVIKRDKFVGICTSHIHSTFCVHCFVEYDLYLGMIIDLQETEHQREPGPIEWFVKTRERKDHSYCEPESQKFVVFILFT